jgi:hypothetical protein
MAATLTDLLARTDLKVITTVTAPACTNDRYIYAIAVASNTLTFSYMVRISDGTLVGRVRRNASESLDAIKATDSTGAVVARGSVRDCLLALWQLDAGSLSPVAKKAVALAA